MKILIFSDIHANFEALKELLGREKFDYSIFLATVFNDFTSILLGQGLERFLLKVIIPYYQRRFDTYEITKHLNFRKNTIIFHTN